MKILIINLKSLGFQDETYAWSLDSALVLCETIEFDVIVYNTHLSDCSCCCEITKKLRAKCDGILLPVVDNAKDCAKLKKIGAVDCLALSDYSREKIDDLISFYQEKKQFKEIVSSVREAIPV